MSGDDTFSIIVGVDGSAESRKALEWAVAEARLRHGHVCAVTAWEYPPVTVGMEGLRWDPDIFDQVARTPQMPSSVSTPKVYPSPVKSPRGGTLPYS